MNNLEKYEDLNAQLDALYKACANEYKELTKTRGFDIYNQRTTKKIKKLTDKYAKFIYPLQKQLGVVVDEMEKEAEEKRKSQFVDVSEYEKMKNSKHEENI